MSSASRMYFWCVHGSVSTASLLVQSHQSAPRLCSLHPHLPLSYPVCTPKPGFLLKIKILFLYSHALSPPRASHCTEDKLQKPLVCPTKPRSRYIRGTHQVLTALGGSPCFSDKESERPPPHSPRALSQMLFSQRGLR